MTRAKANQSFVYHADRIVSPLGNYNAYHDRMRSRWAHAIDGKCYRHLPTDAVAADDLLDNSDDCRICGKRW